MDFIFFSKRCDVKIKERGELCVGLEGCRAGRLGGMEELVDGTRKSTSGGGGLSFIHGLQMIFDSTNCRGPRRHVFEQRDWVAMDVCACSAVYRRRDMATQVM